MPITSTVYALDDRARILWDGDAGEIVGIHEWTFVDVPGGVLDQSLVAWLERLKATAERDAL